MFREEGYSIDDLKGEPLKLINIAKFYYTLNDNATEYFDRCSSSTNSKEDEVNNCDIALYALKSQDPKFKETLGILNEEEIENCIEIISYYKKMLKINDLKKDN